MKLHETDRRAVDLFLDQAQSSVVSQGGPGYAASCTHTSRRVRRVEMILSLLDELPAADPPPDLVKKTCRCIRNRSTSFASPSTSQPIGQILEQ